VTSNGALIFLMGFLFLSLGYMGVPVAFALIASVLVVTLFTPISFASMMGQLFNGMDVEALLAVPFFIMAGNLMNSAGITNRIYNFALALVGWLKGGLGHVNVIGSVMFMAALLLFAGAR